MAGNSLRANDIALQVVGQNIANANTPGYIREELVLKPAVTQKLGGLLLGLGVQVEAVVQKVDRFLEERLRSAVSDRASAETLQQTYSQLEASIGELSDTDLSTSMNGFFSSISEILNQPESVIVRNLAVLQGQTLAQDISRMAQRVEDLRTYIDNRIQNMASDINRRIEQIADLNVKISEAEGGSVSKSDAVGLRDQRSNALEELAKLMDIRAIEQPDGTVTVYSSGDFLVYAGMSRSVEVVLDTENGSNTAEIHISETDAKIEPASGELHGMIDSRDRVLGGYLDNLDDFAKTLVFEFNKIYSSGQGLSGYTTLTSEYGVDDSSNALSDAGLPFTPQNGSFQILVRNKETGLTQTTDILVDLNGALHDMTLDDLKTALDGIDGISAEIMVDGKLKIDSQSSDSEFAFANDTSGVLAALGLNVFFTGTSAQDININAAIKADPAKFAASRGGIAVDTANAVTLANFLDYPIQSQNNQTIGDLYSRMTDDIAQDSATAQSISDGAQTFESSLRGQQLAISGVNLDEEAIKMISYQRAYQASAKFIAAIAELFEVLVNI